MIRTGLMKIIMWAIVPIAFTVIFIVTVDYKEGAPWISLVFVWLAYLTASASCLSNIGSQHAILNYTLTLCAVSYFLIELIAAVTFLYIYTDIPQWAFTTQFLLFVAYVLLFGFVYISNHKTNHQIQELKDDINLVNQWKSKVTLMQLNNPSDKTKELLDILKATPVKSNSAVAAIDEEITNLLDDPSSTDFVIKKIKERNIVLKSIKI